MSFFYKTSLISTTLLIAGLMVSLRIGGVVPEDFVNSDIPPHALHFDSWQTYGSNEWLALAQRLLSEKKLDQAEQAAYKSLSTDPSNGGVFIVLATIYAEQGEPEKAREAFDFGWGAWPSKYYRLSVERAQHQHKQQLQSQLAALDADSTQWINQEAARLRAAARARQWDKATITRVLADRRRQHQQQVENIRTALKQGSQETLETQLQALQARYDSYR